MVNDLKVFFTYSPPMDKYKNIYRLFLSLFYKYSMMTVCYKYVYKNISLITYLNIFAKTLVLLVILYYFCKVKTQLFLIN